MKIRIVIVLFVVLFSSCVKTEKIKIGEIKSISYLGTKNNKIQMVFELPIENQTIYKLEVKDIDAKIKINRMSFGKMSKVHEVIIPPGSREDHDVTVNVEITNIGGGVLALIRGFGQKKMSYDIDGQIEMKMFWFKKTVPFNRRGKVDLKTKNQKKSDFR